MAVFLLSSAVAMVVFIGFLLLLPKRILSDEYKRREDALEKLSDGVRQNLQKSRSINLLKEQEALPTTGIYGILCRIPGVKSTFTLLLKAGFGGSRQTALLIMLGAFLVLTFILHFAIGAAAWVVALLVTYFITRKYLQYRINKRNQRFLHLFPDAIDMIVRSVRSGHPLNTAMKMISENMDPPVSDEFKQVIDEVAYGRTLTDALISLSQRIGEQDLHFFVVVLAVQQETGGSLSEILANLSNIIRKRKQLRLKIQALTSEGRITSYILGGLPVVEFLGLWLMTPDYLSPLFHTLIGNILLGTAITLIFVAIYVVRIMVNIDI